MTQHPDYYFSDGSDQGASIETAHSGANERIGMPVPVPAAPPFPEICHAPPNGVGHDPCHADVTWNVDPKRMDGREVEEYGHSDEPNWQKADGSDPVHLNQLGHDPSTRNATDTTRSGAGVHISMPRARMDCRQDAEPPSKYTDGSDRVQRQPHHFIYNQPQQSTNSTSTNAQGPSRKLKRSRPPSAKEQLLPMFFAGATDVVITGNPSFNYYKGDVCVVNNYTTATSTTTTTTSGGSGNGHGWPQASMNSNSNTGARSSRGPHVGHHVEINLGDDWPFGANSTPPFARLSKGKMTTHHRNRPQSSSMAVGSNPTDPRHTDGKDDRDGYAPTHPDGADGPAEKNPFARYGGDSFGDGMSNFKMSRANIHFVNGVLVEYDPGTLDPL